MKLLKENNEWTEIIPDAKRFKTHLEATLHMTEHKIEGEVIEMVGGNFCIKGMES